MRLILIILALTSTLKLGFGQNYNLISFGINKPIKYSSKKPNRNLGFEFGYSHGFEFKEKIFLETGVSMDFWGKINEENEVYYLDGNSIKSKTLKQSYFKFNIDLPFLVNYRFGKIDIKNGLSFYLRNFLKAHSKYETGYDPELNPNFQSLSKKYSDDSDKLYGLSYQFRISYSITQKISPYLDFKTSILSNQNNYNGKRYGLLNFGMIYKIASH